VASDHGIRELAFAQHETGRRIHGRFVGLRNIVLNDYLVVVPNLSSCNALYKKLKPFYINGLRGQSIFLRTLLSDSYFAANSFFTNSLTNFPSTRTPAALNLAIAFFITVPISFMVGDPISAIAARTPAATSSSPAALGK
jgi:hypothetical protein